MLSQGKQALAPECNMNASMFLARQFAERVKKVELGEARAHTDGGGLLKLKALVRRLHPAHIITFHSAASIPQEKRSKDELRARDNAIAELRAKLCEATATIAAKTGEVRRGGTRCAAPRLGSSACRRRRLRQSCDQRRVRALRLRRLPVQRCEQRAVSASCGHGLIRTSRLASCEASSF